MYFIMNSFVYVIFFAHLGLLTNAFPAEQEEQSSPTTMVEFSPFQSIAGITNSVTNNLRNAAKTTKTITNFVINSDESRTRGFWSWLGGLFGGGDSKKTSTASSSKSQSYGGSAPASKSYGGSAPPPKTQSVPAAAAAPSPSTNQVILKISNTNDFNTKVVNSQTPFLVMYTFDGCKACDKISPTIESYIVSLNGKMLYAKVNVDYVQVPDKQTLTSYPTTQIYHNGKGSSRYGPTDTQNNYKSIISPYVK